MSSDFPPQNLGILVPQILSSRRQERTRCFCPVKIDRSPWSREFFHILSALYALSVNFKTLLTTAKGLAQLRALILLPIILNT